MTVKFMDIPNDETQNYPFSCLQLVVETFEHSRDKLSNQNSVKDNNFKPTNKKDLLKKLWGLV